MEGLITLIDDNTSPINLAKSWATHGRSKCIKETFI